MQGGWANASPLFCRYDMDLTNCFEQIIGLTQANCPCLTGKPDGYNVSKSGYFVDDLEYGIPLPSIGSSADCGEGSIWDLMSRARQEAIRDFVADLSIMITQSNQKPTGSYFGPLANYKESHNSTLTKVKKWAGAKYTPIKYKGSSMRLTELCGFFSSPGPVQVQIFSSLDLDNPINTYVIQAVKNRKSCFALPTPLDLPLSNNGQKVEYYFVYDSTNNKPRNLKWDCGCGSKPQLYSYMKGGGFSIDDLSELAFVNGVNEYTNGLYPVVQIGCDTTGWLCRDWDYMTEPFARVMANTVMYYSIMKLAGFILNSSRINFYTLLKREELFGKRASMRKKIEFNMNYLIDNIPPGASDCIDCRGTYNIIKREILV